MLEKGESLTLALLLTTAATHEAFQSQLASMEGGFDTGLTLRRPSTEMEGSKQRSVLQVWDCRTFWA